MLRDMILDWYVFMSSLSAKVTTDVLLLDRRIGISLVRALLLGLIGAAAPCQLTQSVGMVAVLGRTEAGRPRWRATLAYLAGKAMVYSGLGLLHMRERATLSGGTLKIDSRPRRGIAVTLRMPFWPEKKGGRK